MGSLGAAQAHKPMRENTAFEKGPPFGFDKLRHCGLILLGREFHDSVYQVVWRSTGRRLAIVACSE